MRSRLRWLSISKSKARGPKACWWRCWRGSGLPAAELGLAIFSGVSEPFDPKFLDAIGVARIISDHPGRTKRGPGGLKDEVSQEIAKALRDVEMEIESEGTDPDAVEIGLAKDLVR